MPYTSRLAIKAEEEGCFGLQGGFCSETVRALSFAKPGSLKVVYNEHSLCPWLVLQKYTYIWSKKEMVKVEFHHVLFTIF